MNKHSRDMYGFPLQENKYPFLPSGLPTITPFICSVLCLVVAERVPTFHNLAPRLHELALQTCPVDDYVADEVDPVHDIELGIGPEEITAACVLSMYMPSDGKFSVAAFNWAQGLFKVSV